MRPIINLKKLNQFLLAPHFKMEHLLSFLPSVQPGMFLTSLDLSDAYFSLPIASSVRKFLRFSWGGELYEFQCLCFGFSPAPYIFTKVMKPIFSSLRKDGINSSYYIDDSLFGNKNALVLHQQTAYAQSLLESLGFTVNLEKSSMMPSTTIQHLGFVIDSINMTVSLPSDTLTRLVRSCQDLLVTDRVSIRKLARVIGTIVSSFMAVVHGQLHYRGLEMFKTQCLDQTHNYDRLVTLSNPCRADLLWWRDNAVSANGRSISDILGFSNCSDDLFTDASKSG